MNGIMDNSNIGMQNTELHEYARKVFLRDNHVKYHRYCDDWLRGLTEGQSDGIRIWKQFEDSANLKR